MPQPVTIANQGVLKHAAVSVGTVAVLLTAGVVPSGGKQDMSSVGDRKNITVVNNSANTIYLGADNTVTAATGLPLAAGGMYSADYGSKSTLYAIAAQNGNDVRVLEAY